MTAEEVALKVWRGTVNEIAAAIRTAEAEAYRRGLEVGAKAADARSEELFMEAHAVGARDLRNYNLIRARAAVALELADAIRALPIEEEEVADGR